MTIDIRPPSIIPEAMHDLFWERFSIATVDGKQNDADAYKSAVEYCLTKLREYRADMEA